MKVLLSIATFVENQEGKIEIDSKLGLITLTISVKVEDHSVSKKAKCEKISSVVQQGKNYFLFYDDPDFAEFRQYHLYQ